ncbi:MAG: hypothetical protein PUB21_05035 [Bacteroidales bacterium]|nr:hypothetical protein [Bacteroidales bacterium]
MVRYLLIAILLLSGINLLGQIPSFNEIPKYILAQFDKMGVEETPVLNSSESAYFNVIFEKFRKDFDFESKRIGFITGSTGKTISSKKKYFELEKGRINRNYTPNGGTLYIFDAAQKEESGGYDAAIVYWSKRLIPTEEVIKRLKNKH